MATATATARAAAPEHAAQLEYDAQDRRLHELLEKLRQASYNHTARALGRSIDWHLASELADANEHLEAALRQLGGAS